MEKTVTTNNNNEVLKEYYRTFDEFPFLLTTQTYDSPEYKMLMNKAINRGEPLTQEEIAEWFEGRYDLVENNQGFKNFKKQ